MIKKIIGQEAGEVVFQNSLLLILHQIRSQLPPKQRSQKSQGLPLPCTPYAEEGLSPPSTLS